MKEPGNEKKLAITISRSQNRRNFIREDERNERKSYEYPGPGVMKSRFAKTGLPKHQHQK